MSKRYEDIYTQNYYDQYSVGNGHEGYEDSKYTKDFLKNIAGRIYEDRKPESVLDVGCAMGYLVEALRDLGVEAYGVDVSEYAISKVREDLKPFCKAASALEELPEGRWAEDRAALIRQLAPLLGAYGRRLYVPEIYAAASPETVVLLCTALSGGSLQGRLEETCAAYGAQRLALDLERLMMDFPLPCPSGEGIRLSREELAIRMQGRSVFYAEDLCARYFTYRRGGQTHFVLFDDAGTLRRKIEMGQALGIREGFVMLPEVEDLTGSLFTGEG